MKTKTLLLGIISFAFIFGSCEKQEIEQEPVYRNSAVIDTTDNDTIIVDSINICNDTIQDSVLVAFYELHGDKIKDFKWVGMTKHDSVNVYNIIINNGELLKLYNWEGMTKQDSADVYICNKLNVIDYFNYKRYINYRVYSKEENKIFIYFDYIVGDSIFYCEKTKRNEPAFSITMNDTIVVSRLSHVVIDSLLNKYPY